jgi:hypothetical protein
MIKFKQDSEKHQLRLELERIDFRLRFILMAYAMEMQYRYGFDIVITEIFRTSEEQNYIYTVLATEEEKAKYADNPVTSVHQVYRGIDISCHDMTTEMLDFTTSYFKHVNYDSSKPNIKALVLHNVGLGMHIHLQTCNGSVTSIWNSEVA